VSENFDWMREHYGDRLDLRHTDIRSAQAVNDAVKGVGAVLHFAAQVAVTTSLVTPIDDFEINARGTLNILEAIRAQRDRTGHAIPLLFTSTNKVYGGLDDIEMRVQGDQYEPADSALADYGISEARPLDFHSPYGCSKGAADQYVLDYARSFELPFAVFRMSCIYGPHQKGNEDQGWVAHFLLRALRGEPITLYGDGKQVRDVLYVEDLVNAFQLALDNINRISGRAFNIGGGRENAVSLLEVVNFIEEIDGNRPHLSWGDWRTGDQKFYVSDTRAFQQEMGWQPRVNAREGIARLYEWLLQNDGVTQRLETAAA
jgi:CDP-paratose 2-epimerase